MSEQVLHDADTNCSVRYNLNPSLIHSREVCLSGTSYTKLPWHEYLLAIEEEKRTPMTSVTNTQGNADGDNKTVPPKDTAYVRKQAADGKNDFHI